MFSVIVPLYDKAHTLRRTVEHALAQSFADLELILIDDGSTDGGLGTISDLQDIRIRTVAQANAGPGPARNRGIAAARHEWVAFLDADDVWHPDHLAELDRIRCRFPEAALIGSGFVDRGLAEPLAWSKQGSDRIEAISYLERVGRGDLPFFTSSAAARKSVILDLGGFGNFPRGEDSELWVRIALNHAVARSTRSTVIYVHGTGGITDRALRPWPGEVPSNVAELSPAVARALSARSAGDAVQRAAIDRFVARNIRWWADAMAARGEAAAVRAIVGFHEEPVPFDLRLKAIAAHLPAPFSTIGVRFTTRVLGLFKRWAVASAKGLGRLGLRPLQPGV